MKKIAVLAHLAAVHHLAIHQMIIKKNQAQTQTQHLNKKEKNFPANQKANKI